MTAAQTTNPLEAFHWTPQPRAQALIASLARTFLAADAFARELKERLEAEAGVRFTDLIDAFHVTDSQTVRGDLSDAGFVPHPVAGAAGRFVQEKGIFPAIVLRREDGVRVDLKVESVADFLSAWQLQAEIEGPPLEAMRQARVSRPDSSEVWIVERHGYRGFEVPESGAHEAIALLRHAELLRLRRRAFEHEEQGFAHLQRLLDGAIADLGVNRACDLFFVSEREYWQRRNRAAQVQKARQDRLGIGWANHDHHTYRSSREHFASLIAVFEKLGFHCRERFYAGAQAGWGAQVLEQPNAGIVIFADVDLSPDELFTDFSHEGLPPRKTLGTVGLWCGLHGEALLEAGMHHLECQFDFDALRNQLEAHENVKVMKPFTDFAYLRQAFTEGEIWPVSPQRIDRMLESRQITPDQARHFREHGAIGSHLENLERNDGFKGFNQTGVSEIIARTDPRGQIA